MLPVAPLFRVGVCSAGRVLFVVCIASRSRKGSPDCAGLGLEGYEKRKPRNCLQQSGAMFGRLPINLADQRCRYAKLKCKSPLTQSAIPSRGGACKRLNLVLNPKNRFRQVFTEPIPERPLVYTRKLIPPQQRQGLQPRGSFSASPPIHALHERKDSRSRSGRGGCCRRITAHRSACTGGYRSRKSKS